MGKSKKNRSANKTSGHTDAELRALLTELKIETGDAKDNETLQKLLRRALSKAQHLSDSIVKRGGIDPSTLAE